MALNAPRGVNKGLTSYGDSDFSKYLRRAFLAAAGMDSDDLSRPIIGIADTSSEYTPCHREMPQLVRAVQRGILEAGGLPFVFPTMSLGETFLSPTSMVFRNLMAMETEELIRSQPMDAVVLLGGCDKTVPAQLMAAVSADIPALLVVAGPMVTGSWRGKELGACTDCRHYWTRYRAGELNGEEITEIEQALCPSGGTCMVMGTASTMACVTEVLGLMLPGGATPPAISGDRLRHGVQSGRLAVRLAVEETRPSSVLTGGALANALVVLAAIGGSTNAIIHLLAIARRAGIELSLDDFDESARQVPLLVNCKPAGSNYMEDFHRAGGVPALLKVLEPLLDLTTQGVSGCSLGASLAQVSTLGAWQDTIRPLNNPVGPAGSLAVLRGTLAPNGAVLKVSAASSNLLEHRGPALVFESAEEAAVRLDDPDLQVSPDHVLILRNSGPKGAGMPEAGSLPLPRRLVKEGVRDMVRVSDARMSGTAYGTVVLHCSPESAVGGPLALVRDGDVIELSVARRRIDLLVDETEMRSRNIHFVPPKLPERGWLRLFKEHVLPADRGADLDFLV